MSGDERKADFSNVQGGASSSAPPAPKKADFSNVQAGASSTAPAAPPPESAAAQTYTVAKGDTLSKIAKHFYGNANQWRTIYEANKDRIKNPDLIQVGWVLTIPPKK